MKRAALLMLLLTLISSKGNGAVIANGPAEIAFSRILRGWTNYSTAFNATHDTAMFPDFATIGIVYTPDGDEAPAEFGVILIWDGPSNRRLDFSNFTFHVGLWSSLAAFTEGPQQGNVANADFVAPTGGSTIIPDTTTRGGRPAYELRFDLNAISTVLSNGSAYVIGFAARADTDSSGELFVPTAPTPGASDVQAGTLVTGGWQYLADAGGSTIYSGQVAAELTVRPLIELPGLTTRYRGAYVEILWPSTAEGFELEFSFGFAPFASWHPVEIDPEEDGALKRVTLPVIGNQRFFRLVRPNP